MENVWFLAALWVGLALIATLLAIWLKIPTVIANAFFMPSHLLSETPLSEVTEALADGAP
jgi:hypothetical protein